MICRSPRRAACSWLTFLPGFARSGLRSSSKRSAASRGSARRARVLVWRAARDWGRVMKRLLAALLALAGVAAPVAVQAQASASPYTSATRYDLAGRVVGTIAPDPDGAGSIAYAAVRNTYDVNGWLVKVEKGELAAWQSEAVAPSAWSGFMSGCLTLY